MARVALICAILVVVCGLAFATPAATPGAVDVVTPAAPGDGVVDETTPEAPAGGGAVDETDATPAATTATTAGTGTTVDETETGTTPVQEEILELVFGFLVNQDPPFPDSVIEAFINFLIRFLTDEKKLKVILVHLRNIERKNSLKFSIQESVLNFEMSVAGAGAGVAQDLATSLNSPALLQQLSQATGLTVTGAVPVEVGPIAPAIGNQPSSSSPTPLAPTSPKGSFAVSLDILLAGVNQISEADRAAIRVALAGYAQLAAGSVRITSERTITTSKKFTTEATNLLITAEFTTASQTEANQILQRVRDAVRNNGNRLANFAVLSVNLTTAAPVDAGVMSRPVLALLALAAVIATLVF